MVILYSFLILSLSLGVLTKIEFLPAASVYLYDLITCIIILLNGRGIFLFLKKYYKKLLPIISFLIIGCIGIVFHVKNNTEFLVSLSYLVRLGLYLLLFIPLSQLSQKNFFTLRKAALISGLLFILFGYIQYFYYPNLRNLFYLGWDEHLYRLFSTFLDPNFAGMFIVLTFFLYLSFFTESFKRNNTVLKVIQILGFLYIIPPLFLTYSRASFIAFFVSMFILLVLLKKKLFAFTFIVLFVISLAILPKNFGGEGVNLFRTSSIIARTSEFKKAWEIFLKNPIFGVGFNALRYASQEYGYIAPKDAASSHAAAGVPNSYLYILATSGIAGVGVFVLILRGLFKTLWSKRRSTVFITVSLTAILVGSLFENFLFYAPITIWLIILMGSLTAEKFGTNKSVNKRRGSKTAKV